MVGSFSLAPRCKPVLKSNICTAFSTEIPGVVRSFTGRLAQRDLGRLPEIVRFAEDSNCTMDRHLNNMNKQSGFPVVLDKISWHW